MSGNTALDEDVPGVVEVTVELADGAKVLAAVGALVGAAVVAAAVGALVGEVLVTAAVGALLGAPVVAAAVGAPLGALAGAAEVASPVLGACVGAAPSGEVVSPAEGVFPVDASAELQAVNAIAATAARMSTASRLVCRNTILSSISGALRISNTSSSRVVR